MKYLLVVILLVSVAFSQSKMPKGSKISGSKVANVPSGATLSCGAPYYACGRTFSAYAGQNPVAPTQFHNWGGQTNNGTSWTDPSYPSGTPATVTRCVDGNTLSDHLNFIIIAGRGGASQGTVFVEKNSNFTLLQNTGGLTFAIQLDPANGKCTTNVVKQNYNSACPTHIGNNTCSSSSTVNFNNAYWSRTRDATLFAIGSTDATIGTSGEIGKYVFNTPLASPNTCVSGATNGCYAYSVVAHLANGFPYGTAAPAWTALTNYPFGAYISAQPAGTTWLANNSTFALGDIILVPGCSYFKLTVTGTTGATPPNWAANCNSQGTITDNTATWRATNSDSFIFQCITSTGCISGSSSPTFLNGVATAQMPNGHPDAASVINDATGQWMNSGLNNVDDWDEFGGMGLNEDLITYGFSNETYGLAAGGRYTQWNGGQDSATLVLAYKLSTNTFRLLNNLSNIITQTACIGGTGIDCTGGSWVWSTLGQSNAGCSAAMHEVSNTASTIAVIGNLYVAGPACGIGKRYWDEVQVTFNAGTVSPVGVWNVNHWTTTNNYQFNDGNGGWSGDTTHGIWFTYVPLINAASLNPPMAVQIGTLNCGPPGPVFPFPACSGVGHIDSHTDSAYSPDGDFDPVMATAYASDGASDNLAPDMAWQGEAIVISTNPTTSTLGALPVGSVWREAHVCGWGTTPSFSMNQCISHNSTDGKFMFVSGDCQGTCGSTTGSAPTSGTGDNQFPVAYVPAYGDPAVATCTGGRNWQPSNHYVVGNMIQPVNAFSNGTIFNVFQAVACSGTCTSSSTKPLFGTAPNTGNQIVDNAGSNQITWQNIGNGTCMGTVFMLTLH